MGYVTHRLCGLGRSLNPSEQRLTHSQNMRSSGALHMAALWTKHAPSVKVNCHHRITQLCPDEKVQGGPAVE